MANNVTILAEYTDRKENKMLIIVVSVGGASDREIHDVVQTESENYGYRLREGVNYLQYNAARIAIARRREARELRDKINTLASKYGRDKSNLSLLLVGKSAGAIQIWNVLKRHYGNFDDFHRIALVLIDPHGAAYGDGKSGAYKDSQDLWWPSNWSSDRDFFRVYNIYQQLKSSPSESGKWWNLTGANFPDSRVYRNIRISFGVNHTSIPMHQKSREMIRSALKFACLPRGETVSKPFEITIRNVKGKNTVNGKKEIAFHLDNFKCDCYDADVQVIKDGVLLTTLNNIKEKEVIKYRPTTRGRRITFKASCGTQRVEKQVFLDYGPPTFDSIKVTPNTRRERSMVLFADRVRDDGYWNTSDYQVQVTLDGTQDYSGSGTGITLNNLSDGRHSATMRISDGFGRWSGTKSASFTMSSDRPNLAFIEPRENAIICRGSNFDIAVEASHASGIMRVRVYLDRISNDEFDFTQICTIPGRFGVGQPERKRCPRVPVVSSGSLDWSRGRHKLIGVAVDYSGNETTIERTIRIR